MNCFFDRDRMMTVYCGAEEPRCVRLAVQDLCGDLRKLSGREAVLCDRAPAAQTEDALLVATLGSAAAELPGIDLSCIAGKPEHFVVAPFAQGLAIIGSDSRGTMWGVYECCGRYLHVDPLYLWTDHEPRPVESIPLPGGALIDGPKTYRYRGWFINDEDLIEGFCRQGKSEENYHFQRDYRVMLDMLIETALRLKQNLLIPCSHLDIMRPEDEEIVRRVTERGMYVSMHHQEPVGVHQFTLDRLWAERGGEGNVNFIDHPDFYREVWGESIRRWAKYDGVIWQLGLRGRGDRPVWYQNDRVPESTAERGKLISDAIRTQMEMVRRECPGKDVISTATLWMEGMPLYKEGALTFPEGTIVVQSDFGPDQMWGERYNETPRCPGTEYGVYYHLAFWGCGPHLVEGNRPEKIRFNFRQAQAKGDTAYVVLNVSNFREFVYGARYEAELTWNVEHDDVAAYRTDWCREEFEKEDVAGLEEVYEEYFQCFAPMDDTAFPARMTFNDGMARRVAFKLIEIAGGSELRPEDIQNKRLYDFPDTDTFIAFYLSATEAGLARFARVHEKALRVMETLPVHRRAFFAANKLMQIEIMQGLYGWVNALAGAAQIHRAGGAEEAFAGCVCRAANALERAIEAREAALYGRFVRWYDGDRLMNLRDCVNRTKALVSASEAGD